MWGAHLGTEIQGRIFGRRGSGPQLDTYIDKWLVGGLEHFLFFHILGIIIPSDELIFFRGVGLNHQPGGYCHCSCWCRGRDLRIQEANWRAKIFVAVGPWKATDLWSEFQQTSTDSDFVCLSIIGLLWDWFQWKFTGQTHTVDCMNKKSVSSRCIPFKELLCSRLSIEHIRLFSRSIHKSDEARSSLHRSCWGP